MLDAETTVYGPNAYAKGEQRVVVSMKTQGLELLLFFRDLSAEGPMLELRLLPDEAELEPKMLRRLIPQAPLFAQYARATILLDRGDAAATSAALRRLGATRRGLTDDFYRLVAANYADLVAEGEPHPVKALGLLHGASISAASRWLTEARRRGLLDG